MNWLRSDTLPTFGPKASIMSSPGSLGQAWGSPIEADKEEQ